MQLSSAAEDNSLKADDVTDSYSANKGHVRVVDADESYETHPPSLPEVPNYNTNGYPDAGTAAKHEPALTGRERRSLFTRESRSPRSQTSNAYGAGAGPKSRAVGARSSHFLDQPPALPAAAVGPLSPGSPDLSPISDFASRSENRYGDGSPSMSSDWVFSTDEHGKRYRENTRTGEWYYV